MIETAVQISKAEVYKLIKDHMRLVHKLDVDELQFSKNSSGNFDGFNLKIMKIETSMEEIHESTPTFEGPKEKVMI